MKLTILGSGDCSGTPQLGCSCRICKLARKVGHPYARTRFTILVETNFQTDKGNKKKNILIDTSPDLRYQLIRAGVEQIDAVGVSTGFRGFFFQNSQNQRYWYHGEVDAMGLYSAEYLNIYSHPGLAYDLMKAGFEHQGHTVVSEPEEAPFYKVQLDVHSAIEWGEAVDNLKSKSNYIRSIEWVEIAGL